MSMSNPFKRANAMITQIAAIMALQLNFAEQQARLNELGPYQSKGKGKGTFNRSAKGAGMAAHRASVKRRNQLRHRAHRA